MDSLASDPQPGRHLHHRLPIPDHGHDRFETLFHDASLDEHPAHPLATTTQREEKTTAPTVNHQPELASHINRNCVAHQPNPK